MVVDLQSMSSYIFIFKVKISYNKLTLLHGFCTLVWDIFVQLLEPGLIAPKSNRNKAKKEVVIAQTNTWYDSYLKHKIARKPQQVLLYSEVIYIYIYMREYIYITYA